MSVCTFREADTLARRAPWPRGPTGGVVRVGALSSLQFPAANRPVVTALATAGLHAGDAGVAARLGWQTRLTDNAIDNGCALVYLRGLEQHLSQLAARR
jgi:hypothetical protein